MKTFDSRRQCTLSPGMFCYAKSTFTGLLNLQDEKKADLMNRVEQVRKDRKLAYTYFMILKNRRFTEFSNALRVIRGILKTTYRQLTLGGDASLEPIDRFDPFSEGLEFMFDSLIIIQI